MLADVSVDPAATVGVRNVTVTNPGGASVTCTGCFRVNAKPTVASVSPSAKPVGAAHQALTVTGTGFQAGATVSLGAGITVHSATRVDATHLTLDVSVAANAALGARTATVTNPDAGIATKTAAFTVNPLPTATAVSPNSVRQGQTATVQITGTGFQSGAGVSFGSDVTVNSVTFNASNKLTVSITPGTNAVVGAHTATVTNPDGGRATCTNCLTVVAIPHVTSIAPASRPVGASAQTITVTGSGYAPGVTAKLSGSGVTINSLTRTSATSLKLVVSISGGATAGGRNLTLTNPDTGTTTCTNCFTVNAKPTIGTLTPSSRARGTANQVVTLSGSGFQAGAKVTVSGTGVTATVTALTPTKLTLSVTVAGNAATGNRTVTVTNPDTGAVAKGNAFRVT